MIYKIKRQLHHLISIVIKLECVASGLVPWRSVYAMAYNNNKTMKLIFFYRPNRFNSVYHFDISVLRCMAFLDHYSFQSNSAQGITSTSTSTVGTITPSDSVYPTCIPGYWTLNPYDGGCPRCYLCPECGKCPAGQTSYLVKSPAVNAKDECQVCCACSKSVTPTPTPVTPTATATFTPKPPTVVTMASGAQSYATSTPPVIYTSTMAART